MQGIEKHQNTAALANTQDENALMTLDRVQNFPHPVNMGKDLYEEGEEDEIYRLCIVVKVRNHIQGRRVGKTR